MAAAKSLAILALLAICCRSSALASTGLRHLTQAPGSVASCFWLEKESLCVPSYQNMLAVPASTQPTNAFRKAYLMALDRSDKCSRAYDEAGPCNADVSNRCFWRTVNKATDGICLSADYAEVSAFERSGFTVDVGSIPFAMTCPGTKAAQFFACYAHPAPDMCSKLAGCTPAPAALTQGKPVCLPKWAATLDKKASDALAAQLKALDPALYGSCEATCWLKQARTCSAIGSNQAACEKNPQCVFNPQMKACLRAQVAKPGKDVYDDKLSALMGACGKITKKADCTSKTVQLEQAGKWAAWKTPSTAAQC